MNVQTNGVPNHCFDDSLITTGSVSTALSYEYSVIFNRDVRNETYNYEAHKIGSITETTDVLCGLETPSEVNLPTKSLFSTAIPELGTTATSPPDTKFNSVVGVAISGGLIF